MASKNNGSTRSLYYSPHRGHKLHCRTETVSHILQHDGNTEEKNNGAAVLEFLNNLWELGTE
jgi:hypothetical protein